MTVAVAHAEAMHHAAPRGLKTAGAEEEVEHETHSAPTATEDSTSGGAAGASGGGGRSVGSSSHGRLRRCRGAAGKFSSSTGVATASMAAPSVSCCSRTWRGREEEARRRELEAELQELDGELQKDEHERRMRLLDRQVHGDQLTPAESYARGTKKRQKKKLARCPLSVRSWKSGPFVRALPFWQTPARCLGFA